jgi:hypothetical protein
MVAANVVRPSGDQAAYIAQTDEAVETFIRGRCSDTCAAFATTWDALRPVAKHLPPKLASECKTLAKDVRGLAAIAGGLQLGRYELANWQDEQGQLHVGVVPAGSVHTELGWGVVPVLLIGVAAVGVWVLVDLYLRARELEARAAVKTAELQQQAQNAIASAPADQRAALAAAFAKANAALNPPDWLTRVGMTLANAGAAVGRSVGSSIGGAAEKMLWPLLGIGLVLVLASRKGRLL